MKKLTACLGLLILLTPFLFGDNLKFTEFTASAGRSAFTSGLDLTGKFANEKNSVQLTANHERFYGVFFWKLPLHFKVGICAGAFKNMVQAGPYVVFSPTKFISAYYWRGWGFGEPDKPAWKIHNFFELVGGSLNFKGLGLNYAYMVFQGQKTHLPGISYELSLTEKFRTFTSVDYNSLTKGPLFCIGLSYLPK
ncbi:MAG: hypothetical protein Q8N81_02415 [bacterium]|nr:hypothetical protein [bacterium]